MSSKRHMKNAGELYGPRGRKASKISAVEQAPGMAKTRLAGGGLVGSDAANPKSGDKHRHSHCSEGVRDFFREIKASLDEVYPKTVDEWEDGFLKDLFPEQEIAIWLRIAEVYRQRTAGKSLSLEEKKEYFTTLLICTFSSPASNRQRGPGKWLSEKEVRDTVAAFYGWDGDKGGSGQAAA